MWNLYNYIIFKKLVGKLKLVNYLENRNAVNGIRKIASIFHASIITTIYNCVIINVRMIPLNNKFLKLLSLEDRPSGRTSVY